MLNPEENYDRHIYLYAKHWYKVTDRYNDLKIIVAKRCGLDAEHVSKEDIIQVILPIVEKYVKLSEFVINLLPSNTRFRDNLTIEDNLLNECLITLSLTEIKDSSGNYLPGMNIGDPDPNILPLK
jgi:hypothetical protein